VDDATPALDSLVGRLRAAPIAPLALELVNAALAGRLGAADRCLLVVRLGGNAESVRAQRDVLAALGDVAAAPPSLWSALRACEPARATVARLSQLPSQLAETWSFAREATSDVPGALVHATLGRGVVRCVLPHDRAEELATFLNAMASFPGTRVFERLPAMVWRSEAAPSAVLDRLSRGVKRSFDPMNILNPGILGDDA
jgi:hypothetical protein